MKNKITILGSTGSIGITTLNIIRVNKKNFDVTLLSTNNKASKIFNQAKEFKVKNVIITNRQKYLLWKKKFKKNNIKIYNNFENFNRIFKKKINYSINAISGIEGLIPTLKIIKYTKVIAIANKESIICGWNLISKELKKCRTRFIPVDSEHFSIHKLIEHSDPKLLKQIIITASGGPFLNKNINRKISLADALKHPNWKMGKKITIDSSTLMNKVFEVIEAKKIFSLNLKKINVLINPNSYLHSIVIFKNGIVKMLAHETDMSIPIFNSIYEDTILDTYKTKNLDLNKINNLNLTKPDVNKFTSLKILKLIPNKDSLFETVLICVNDELVKMFLNKEIDFKMLIFYLNKIIKFKIFKKYCNVRPKSVNQILILKNYVRKIVINYVKSKN